MNFICHANAAANESHTLTADIYDLNCINGIKLPIKHAITEKSRECSNQKPQPGREKRRTVTHTINKQMYDKRIKNAKHI